MGSVSKYFEKKIPGVYVHSLMIGDNVVQDTENGFFLNINSQIEMACQKIKADPNLKGCCSKTVKCNKIQLSSTSIRSRMEHAERKRGRERVYMR